MQQTFIGDFGKNDRLILIFAGWGMDGRVFSDLHIDGYDVMVVWRYVDTDFNKSLLDGYSEIYLFAWSFGVYVASAIMESLESLPLMLRVAINGSVTPVDDLTGIPEAIFFGTLNGLDARNLAKFYRRMCASSEDYRAFTGHLPQRDLDDLRIELKRIFDLSREKTSDASQWDRAVISIDDRIFPFANLERSWAALPRVRTVEGGHLPDFMKIIEQEIIDKELVSASFTNSLPTYDDEAVVQRSMAEELWSKVCPLLPQSPTSLLEIGSGTGMLTSIYADKLPDTSITLCDLVPYNHCGDANIVIGDAESLIREVEDESFDVILSAATVQWFNNLPRFISNAVRKLKSGGVMAISTFGPENMKEITELTHLPLRYYTLEELKKMVPEGAYVAVADEERRIMGFKSVRGVMLHLNRTGVNCLRRVAISYSEMAAKYPREDGLCKLTYHPQYIIIKRNSNE